MGKLFDGYLVVDWSANSRPKTGADSIWWCHLAWNGDALKPTRIANPATRHDAYRQLSGILHRYNSEHKRVLLGMDFSYGYPRGFAQELVAAEQPYWRGVWRYLYEHVQDAKDNANNRFTVAADINKKISGGCAPFWGCPKAQSSKYLSMHKPVGKLNNIFPEYRIAEEANTAQSVWKLLYAGAVGSQILMGLPYLYQWITDDDLAGVSRVWPFDTGLMALTNAGLEGINIVHAEIYPSLIKVRPRNSQVKDKLQVESLAKYFAELDAVGKLSQLFAAKRKITGEQRDIIENEEGWILGV